MVSCPVEPKPGEAESADDDDDDEASLSLLTMLMPKRTGWPGFGWPSKIVFGAVSKGISFVAG